MLQIPGVLGLALETLAFLQRLTSHRPRAAANVGVDESEDALAQAFIDLQRPLVWESPLLIVLEDLQHADQFSRRLREVRHYLAGNSTVRHILSTSPAASSLAVTTLSRLNAIGRSPAGGTKHRSGAPDASRRM
jgi:predicted ATPase